MKKMTRQSFQKGHVSRPIRTSNGETIFKIRYRLRTAEGKWKQKSETLRGVKGRKEARAILEQRIQEMTPEKLLASELTLKGFIEAYWRHYLDRKCAKPSTRANYESALRAHVLPVLGDLRITDVVPLHIENFLQQRLSTGLSPKTVLNLVALLQCIFSVAVDNDLITRSPVRKRHKPVVQRREKPIWTADQVRLILAAVPARYRALFATAALTGARLGELLGLQWKHVDPKQRKLRIEQSLWQDQLLPPKTAGSVRSIHFGDGLASVFAEHSRTACRTGADDFVFLSPTGAPLHPDVLRKDVLVGSTWHPEKVRGVRFPYVPAFRGKLHQLSNWEFEARPEAAWARYDRHDGQDLYSHHS